MSDDSKSAVVVRTVIVCAFIAFAVEMCRRPPEVDAASVYKCKGPNGEVTFTNVKCPEKTQAEHYSSYTPAADSPDQYVATVDEAEATRARDEAAAQSVDAERARRRAQRDATSDLVSALGEDQRSIAGREARRARLEREAAAATAAREDVPTMLADDSPSARAPVINNCSSSGGSLTCFGSDGSISNGNVNANGSATMFGSDGSIRQMPVRSANGRTCTQFGDSDCN